jgi:hypothetical protein
MKIGERHRCSSKVTTSSDAESRKAHEPPSETAATLF